MKMAYNEFSSLVEISPGRISSLVIENETLLFRFLRNLKETLDGYERGICFSVDDVPVDSEKNVELLTDFISFEINEKNLLNKIIKEFDKKALEENYYLNGMELLSHIEKYVLDIAANFSCNIFCDKLNMLNILKAVGISIEDEYENLEERLLAYMDLVQEFLGERLFIFVNARCLITHIRLQQMVDTALQREYKILFIDNVEYKKLNQEDRLIIDADRCEI